MRWNGARLGSSRRFGDGVLIALLDSPLFPSCRASATTHSDRVDVPTATGGDIRSSSGLTPAEVGVALAVLVGVFVSLLIVGMLCKLFNKPRKEAAPYIQNKLFQPSAAGYGSRAAMQQAQTAPNFGSRVSLLGNAGPMGFSQGDNADTSMASNESHNDSLRGHTRGQSSGIELPGATAVSSRKGAAPGARHPTYSGLVGPDGSGFRPGQVINMENRASTYAGNASQPGFGAPQNVPAHARPAHARVGMGPPPAADARRRSRYTRGASRRIDSMGPGQMRKSMYLGMDDDAMNSGNYRRSRRISRKFSDGPHDIGSNGASSGGLRRVDSVGKGDHRRRSVHRAPSNTYNANNTASMYAASANATPSDRAVLRSAQADNFGSGRGGGHGAGPNVNDPLNAVSRGGEGAVGRPGFLMAPDSRSRSGSGSGSQTNSVASGGTYIPTRQYSDGSSLGSASGSASNASPLPSPGGGSAVIGMPFVPPGDQSPLPSYASPRSQQNAPRGAYAMNGMPGGAGPPAGAGYRAPYANQMPVAAGGRNIV